jgi:hypothetical protein
VKCGGEGWGSEGLRVAEGRVKGAAVKGGIEGRRSEVRESRVDG